MTRGQTSCPIGSPWRLVVPAEAAPYRMFTLQAAVGD